MSIVIRMTFYATECPDGTIHVQNVVMGHLGQHHVHTKESFQRWKKNVRDEDLKVSKGECNCGLKPGDVKEYDGQVWHNKKWE